MTETALLVAYGIISILVLIGYSWLMRDLKKIIRRLTWSRRKEKQIMDLLKTLTEEEPVNIQIVERKPEVYPKGRNAKNYVLWSRKGNCPGCSVQTGIKHRDSCPTREELLRQL